MKDVSRLEPTGACCIKHMYRDVIMVRYSLGSMHSPYNLHEMAGGCCESCCGLLVLSLVCHATSRCLHVNFTVTVHTHTHKPGSVEPNMYTEHHSIDGFLLC